MKKERPKSRRELDARIRQIEAELQRRGMTLDEIDAAVRRLESN